jgi:hypothetical protein
VANFRGSLDLWFIFGRKEPHDRYRQARSIGVAERPQSAQAAASRIGKRWSTAGSISAGSAGRAIRPTGGSVELYIGNGKYRVTTLGLADDAVAADGLEVLSFEQGAAKARAMVATPNGGGTIERLTVRQAMDRYVEFK